MRDLLSIKEHLFTAANKSDEVQLLIDRVSAALDFLQNNAHATNRMQEKLQEGKQTWQEIQKLAPITKALIAPLVREHGTQQRGEISAYEDKARKFCQNFKQHAFWKYETGVVSVIDFNSFLFIIRE